jgi:hypothetical protein
VGDVLHERRVRTDHEDAAETLTLREEEERGAVEPDGGLAGSRAALDDERRLGLASDEPVLVGLDRRDDVAHVRLAAALELVEEEVPAGDRSRPVEGLVAHVEQAPAFGAEPAPEGDVVRLRRGRDVERPRRGRLPVDDEHLALVVVHPPAAHVERLRRDVEVEAAEAEPPLRVLERAQPAHRPRLERERRDLAVGRVRGSLDEAAHPVETVVRVVDVRLLRRQVRVRHADRMVAPSASRQPHGCPDYAAPR